MAENGFPGCCSPAMSRVLGKSGAEPWDPGWEAVGTLHPPQGPRGTRIAWHRDHSGGMPALRVGMGSAAGSTGFIHTCIDDLAGPEEAHKNYQGAGAPLL